MSPKHGACSQSATTSTTTANALGRVSVEKPGQSKHVGAHTYPFGRIVPHGKVIPHCSIMPCFTTPSSYVCAWKTYIRSKYTYVRSSPQNIFFSLGRCLFSIGGDGALNVLDDADATGYIKPSTKRQNSTREPPSSSQRSTRAEGWRGNVPPSQRPSRPAIGRKLDDPPAYSQRRSRGTWLGSEALYSRPCSRANSTVPSEAEPRQGWPSGPSRRRALTNQASTREAYTQRGEGRHTTSESPNRGKHEDAQRAVVDDLADATIERGRGGGGGGGGERPGEGRRSVLLRQVIFTSGSSDGEMEEEGGEGGGGNQRGVQGLNVAAHPNVQGIGIAPKGVCLTRKHRPTTSSLVGKETAPPYTANSEHIEEIAKSATLMNSLGNGRGEGVSAGARAGSPALSENNSSGLRRQGSASDMPGRTPANFDGMEGKHASSSGGGRYSGGSSVPTSNVRFDLFQCSATMYYRTGALFPELLT